MKDLGRALDNCLVHIACDAPRRAEYQSGFVAIWGLWLGEVPVGAAETNLFGDVTEARGPSNADWLDAHADALRVLTEALALAAT